MTDPQTPPRPGFSPDLVPPAPPSAASRGGAGAEAGRRADIGAFALREAPYIVAFVLALVGAALTGLRPGTGAGYWQWIAPVFAAICVWTQWGRAKAQGGRLRLVVTQALHWSAFLGTMYLIFSPDIQALMSGVSAALIVLYMTALALFLVGVYYGCWQLGVIGVLLALVVPIIALFDRGALFLFIVAGVVLGAGYLVVRLRLSASAGNG